jgi:hypothetical protein
MATAYYGSLDEAEVVSVEFLTLQGEARSLQLLVDSGFTGKSSVILGKDAMDLVRAEVPPAQATGALQGPQNRAWVTCRIAGLRLQSTLIAIITDIAPLLLPPGVQGMVGLSFLRQFSRWGSERTTSGWQFFLSDTEK